MTDTANESMTAAEYREQQAGSGRRVTSLPAVAVDPGTTTGVAVAFADGEIKTYTTTFWGLMDPVGQSTDITIVQMQDPTYIVEAPYKTEWGKAQDNSAMAYNSGGVAREAELLVEGLERRGYEVIKHDPHSSGNSGWGGGKWDSQAARLIIGGWDGPDNEHTRDALRMLFWYDAI